MCRRLNIDRMVRDSEGVLAKWKKRQVDGEMGGAKGDGRALPARLEHASIAGAGSMDEISIYNKRQSTDDLRWSPNVNVRLLQSRAYNVCTALRYRVWPR